MASGLDATTRVFTTFNDGILDSYPSNFSADEGNVDGMIVGSKVTDTTMEVTFLIPVNKDSATDANDADLSTAHSSSNTFYIFGKKTD